MDQGGEHLAALPRQTRDRERGSADRCLRRREARYWIETREARAGSSSGGRLVAVKVKTLPIARSSVLIGRTVSTVIVGLPSLAVMIGCALAVGWRPHGGLGSTIGAFALLTLFGFAMGWVGAAIGLLARSPQSADALSMVPSFLLGFISNVFVDPARMPAWLRVAADWNPMSAVVASARDLFHTAQGAPPAGVWSLQHPIVTTLAMCALLLVVLVPLSVRRYTRSAR